MPAKRRQKLDLSFSTSAKEASFLRKANDPGDSCQLPSDVCDWTSEDVHAWMESIGLGQYGELVCSEHKVDGAVLLTLTERDLRKAPLQISVLGDIKRFMAQLSLLKKSNRLNVSPLETPMPSPNGDIKLRYERSYSANEPDSQPSGRRRVRSYSHRCWRKLTLTMLYSFTVYVVAAFTMTVAHSRVPDMSVYRPLPDIALDNIPHIPWAFKVTECIGLVLSLIFITILIFHKHRLLIISRMNILSATVFLLRCFTMIVTSLSVPGSHLECRAGQYKSYQDMLWRSLEITCGLGMSLTGVHTCGDYMFSGHTVVLTMLNFAISEYTPRQFRQLHLAAWVMNLFGAFFILAGHEHYSIDVVIAFIITSRIFLYYHALANSRALHSSDHVRTREWFPLFTFVEEGVGGDKVPNEYEVPFSNFFLSLWRSLRHSVSARSSSDKH